ncbi:unnamed protein product [Peniophora sp. CBMAI 1063]|nr:unnamed protein product [Peniophora sp. CBMAI 1063]
MADIAAPPVPPKLKPIIKHWASYAGPTASSSRSSSTSTEDDSSLPTVSHEIHTMRSSSSLPTRPPSPAALQNIKFAPLPHIEPRRRKSNVKLGVAARSRMIAARRGQLPPDWNDAESSPTDEPHHQGPLVEDPFEVFGRYVLVKSKNLWRRVSPKPPTPAAVVVGEVQCDTEHTADTPDTTDPEKAEGATAVQLEAVHADERGRSHDGEDAGGVWEEEINGEQLQQHVSRVGSTPKKDKEAKKARRISLIRKESPPVEA